MCSGEGKGVCVCVCVCVTQRERVCVKGQFVICDNFVITQERKKRPEL